MITPVTMAWRKNVARRYSSAPVTGFMTAHAQGIPISAGMTIPLAEASKNAPSRPSAIPTPPARQRQSRSSGRLSVSRTTRISTAAKKQPANTPDSAASPVIPSFIRAFRFISFSGRKYQYISRDSTRDNPAARGTIRKPATNFFPLASHSAQKAQTAAADARTVMMEFQ